MSTTKLGLPTITGDNTADVVRDLDALAEAIDAKAGANSGLAQLDATGDLPLTQGDNILNWVKGFGLGDVAKNVTGDANAIDMTGFYRGYNLTNQPAGASNDFYYINIKFSALYKSQRAINYVNGATFTRVNNNGTWTAWAQLATTALGTTAAAGLLQLVDSITSTSTTQAATANSVKLLQDWAKGYGIGTNLGKYLNASEDLNTINTGGFYYAGATPTNKPEAKNGYLLVIPYTTVYTAQLFISFDTNNTYKRSNNNGTWSAWTQIETTAGAQTKVDTHAADYVKHPGYGTTTNTANAYAVTLTPAPTAYADGMGVSIKVNANSTAAFTLNVNGLGAKAVKKADGTDALNVKTNGVYSLRYNSATGNFILQGEGGELSDTQKVDFITATNGILNG